MMLQEKHGNDECDVCLKHQGRLVDANHSPNQADMLPGQTVVLVKFPCRSSQAPTGGHGSDTPPT